MGVGFTDRGFTDRGLIDRGFTDKGIFCDRELPGVIKLKNEAGVERVERLRG